MERRGLTENALMSIKKESRLDKSSITEDLALEAPTARLGKEVKVPEKLSGLRRKLGQKAKQGSRNSLRMPKARVFGKAQCGKSACWV
jgi:hypothetical protein